MSGTTVARSDCVRYLLPFLLGTCDSVEQGFSLRRRDELVHEIKVIAITDSVVRDVHKRVTLCRDWHSTPSEFASQIKKGWREQQEVVYQRVGMFA